VPLGGFSVLESSRGQKALFTLHKINYDNTRTGPMTNLPIAHTCFNRLDLPEYPDYDTLKIAIDYIAQNEILGFGAEE
jgi:E3 ubiquitin-protein ligase NEDD4